MAAADYDRLAKENRKFSAVSGNTFLGSYPTKAGYVEEWWEERYLPVVLPKLVMEFLDGDGKVTERHEFETGFAMHDLPTARRSLAQLHWNAQFLDNVEDALELCCIAERIFTRWPELRPEEGK